MNNLVEKLNKPNPGIDGICLVDIIGKQTIYLSPSYTEIMGRHCENYYINPNSFLEAIHPEDREEVKLECICQQQELTGGHMEFRIFQSNGQISWVCHRSFPMTNSQGQVNYVISIVEDITNRLPVEIAQPKIAALPNENDELTGDGGDINIRERIQAEAVVCRSDKKYRNFLQQQLSREKLLAAITLDIRKTLEIERILLTAVNQTRQILQADRVLIFRLNKDGSGEVVKESVVPDYPVTLTMRWVDECFPAECYEFYSLGNGRIVADTTKDDWGNCLVEFMQESGVKSKMVAPIVQRTEENAPLRVWGLLIAHACAYQRQWQPTELDLLKHIANQLAIAIQQADLYQEIQSSEAKYRQSEEQLRSIFENAGIGIAVVTPPDFRLVQTNPALQKMLGYSAAELANLDYTNITHPKDVEIEKKLVDKCLNSQSDRYRLEKRFICKNGAIIWGNLTVSLIRDQAGNFKFGVGMIDDISDKKRVEAERRQTEAKIKASLQEKEVLLKEVHHRVKNNLQLISSLLDLQVRRVTDKQLRETLRDSQNRVKSMALVHETLYASHSFTGILFADYVRNLATQLFHTYCPNNSVQLNIKVDADISVNLDQAIPCGLLLNELITNALKYGFPENQFGMLSIDFRLNSQDKLLLAVGNDGDYLPAQFDIYQIKSLGLQLVINLVTQLEGTIELERGDRTVFKITFPVT